MRYKLTCNISGNLVTSGTIESNVTIDGQTNCTLSVEVSLDVWLNVTSSEWMFARVENQPDKVV